jgi:DNA-binding NarL/FixJ family response regulator
MALETMRAAAGRIDLVLLDLGLRGCAGIASLTLFRDACPEVPVVVLSASEERATVTAALAAGAAGYLPKTSPIPVISAALQLVAAGGRYVPPQALELEPDGERDEQRVPLTERQQDVLRLIAKGLANKEIARHLNIARDTVKQHTRAVYAALGVAGRAQAAHVAGRRGIKLE